MLLFKKWGESVDFDLLKRKMINNKFSLSYRNGEKLFKENKVEIIDVREIEDISYIYGRVTDDRKVYSTFIKSDSKRRILKLSCNCEIHEESRKSGSSFACSHLIATILQLTKKINRYERDSKDDIEISVLLEESYKKDYLYDISLFIKDKSRIRISTKADLEYYILNDKAIYSFKRVSYSKTDKALIKMLSKLNMKIKDEDLREVLFLCRYKKVQAKIKSMQYNTDIIMKDMPLRFTLKLEQNRIKLQRRKDNIIALNKEKTAFIFNEEIYIPPFKQCRGFSLIYSILKDKYHTYVNRSSLKKVIGVLSEIGELSLSDEVKNILTEEEVLDLYFYKEDGNIYCEFLNKENYIKTSAKFKSVEEILFMHGFTKQNERYLFTRDDEELLKLLKTELVQLCNIKSSKSLGNLNIISSNKFKGKIKKEYKDLFFELDLLDNNDEIVKAIESFRKGEKFYRFKNYSFLDFTNEDIREYMRFLSFIDYKGEDLKISEEYEDFYFEEGEKLDFIGLINRDKEEGEMITPTGLKVQLRDYQLAGVNWIQNKKNNGLFGVLADEMGLGKTIQTISFLMLNKGQKSMIIVPTSLIYNWVSEFKKFAPKLKIACIHGDKKKREKLINSISDYDVVLTSYGTINMDIDLYSDIKFDNLILDEGQTIKNLKSKITTNVKKIEADFKLVLTGTPIENNLMELWSIFDFLKSGYLFSENEFKRKFLKSGESEIKYLRLLIKQFILRRTKKDVLSELPDKNLQTVYVTMDDEQKKIYKDSISTFRKEAKSLNDAISILALLTKLREIALDPHLIYKDYEGKSAKTEKLLEIIKESVKEKKKILVFSQFTGMLDIIKNKMDEAKIKYYYLDGSTKASERVNLCNEFNKKKRTKVFLISLKAGGTGLNLTSAEKVIHIDPWWNPAVENQATDRAHRIGQKNEVDVIKLITKGTIEEKIMILKEEKSKMISELLDDEVDINVRNTLTKEEIEYLLNYDDI